MIFSKTPFRISFVGGGTDNLKKQNFKEQYLSGNVPQYELEAQSNLGF